MIRGKWVALAGGLGNQLFQYAHSISNGIVMQEASLECVGFSLGGENTTSPEIAKFHLPLAKVSSNRWSNSYFEQRSFNYLLRASTQKNAFWKFDPISLSARAVITPRVMHMYLEKLRSARIEFSSHSPHLEIGYFQNEGIAETVLSQMRNLSLQQSSVILNEYIALSEREKPLVIHVRRGDYRFDLDLGCLSENYYRNLLDQVWDQGQFNKIWLFSDDPEASLNIFDKSLHRFIRLIDQKISTAETFEILRLGSGYIIANSSFSFWAAALCKNEDSAVYAPAPWFRKTLFQDKNFPSDWKLMPSHFTA